jgi:replicative DNA helicase
MSLVPALDLRPPEDETDPHLPANIEAESALLGCLLYDNSAYERVGDNLRPEHFFEPFHQRLFAAIEVAIRKGQLAEPILLMPQFQADPAFHDLGGVRYLADLVERAPPPPNAPEYGRAIHDAFLRRQVIEISQDAISVAQTGEAAGREIIEDTEGRFFHLAENRSGVGVVSFSEAIAGAVQHASEAVQRDGGLSGLSTGLIDLDQKTGGLHRSDLIIIAARPSMGKSSLAANIAYEAARRYRYEVQPDGTRKTIDGGQGLFFSLEMSAEQLALRLAAAAAGISGDKIRKGEISASEFGRFRDAALEIQDIPLHIDATGGLPLAKLYARARRQKRLTGLDLIIVDYLQLIDAGIGARANRVEQLTVITTGLKALAKELDVPVIALSQLSRQVEQREDKKPQLSDLRESGSIEQDADTVWFIYREDYYLERLEPRENTQEHFDWQAQMEQVRGQADIIVGKARHGPIGTVKVAFNGDLTKFSNLAREGRYGGYGRNPAGD